MSKNSTLTDFFVGVRVEFVARVVHLATQSVKSVTVFRRVGALS